MITTDDITRAEAAEANVRERADVLRRRHNIDGGESTERARRRVEELRSGKERQDAALKERAAVVKAHGAELKKLAAGLDKSASGVAEAAREASEVLRRLLAVTEAHTAAVGAAHGHLMELALPLADEACSEYAEGAGGGGLVRLGGRSYGPVAGDVVVGDVVARLARAEWGELHSLSQVTRTLRHLVAVQQGPARELLARLP